MLKIPHGALLTPDLLWVLAAMGHGDDIAVVDALHPAERIARRTTHGRVVRLAGVCMEDAVRAILSVMPLDDFVPDPVRRMEVVDDRAAMPEVQRAVQALLPAPMHALERFAFYAAEEQAFAVVQVGDARPYGCFLMRKGVVRS
jgi:L-fucose mutarotase